MKKHTNFFMSIMLIVSIIAPFGKANAGDVDKNTARKVGAYFLASQFGEKSITDNSLQLVYEIPNTLQNITAVYVFNTNDQRGYVVVAGSDCVDPIIAYSTEGALDPNNIPPSMMWWLNGTAQDIVYAQNNNLEPSREAAKEWDILIDHQLPYFGSAKETVQLMTSKWDQSPLYNNLCPVDDGGRCVTGCVATAMAQILYYWKYPRVGRYSNYILLNGEAYEANFANTYYNYDLMVDRLTNNSTPEQINAVALLNYHCGISVDMDYSSESSGAVSAKVPYALQRFFKYEKDSLNHILRSDSRYYHPNNSTTANQKDSNWYNDILEQLMKKRPVFYAAADVSSTGADARHAFVCDGYNTANKFMHFNWGWGGSGTGWCNVYNSKLNTGRGYNFTAEHQAILGITPPLDSIPENMRPTSNVAINTVPDPFQANITPNPASDHIAVYYQIQGENSVPMQIYDATGRLVKQIPLTPASTRISVDINDLKAGIYICRIQGHTRKFIVK